MIREDFAGPGGWSEALHSLDVDGAVGYEFDQAACETATHAGHLRVLADVRYVEWSGPLTGYIASPPCQTFSPAGKGNGRAHLDALRAAAYSVGSGKTVDQALGEVSDDALDQRSALVLHPLTVVRDYRPQWVALEQVTPVLPVWETYALILAGWGYSAATGIVYAEEHGVPQTRRRAVLVAHLDRKVALPAPTHSRYYPRNPGRLDLGVAPWVSMAEALGWGLAGSPSPTITGGGTETGGAEPIAHLSHRYTDRPDWTFRRPSTTIVGSFRPEIVAAPGYRTTVSRQNAPDSVRVTVAVAEAGILQSFRPDYPWHGSKGKQYQQVGNSVPPLMGAAILAPLL